MSVKRVALFSISGLFLLGALVGCGKHKDLSQTGEMVKSGSSSQEKPEKPGKEKQINLGQAEPFVILAYSNISSFPSLLIKGKVGLMPGTRDMMKVSEAEVAGGAADILAADTETDPPNLLSLARLDMVVAYGKSAALAPDEDKDGLTFSLGGKKLKPGVYRWSKDLSASLDFSLEGDEKAVWIFQIPGHLKIGDGVKMNLLGGAKASHVFWQVAGSAVMGASSEMAGTIFAQQFIELKESAVLKGRAFAKNGYVLLNQASLLRP